MLVAPLPDQEQQRLEELRSYQLLDTGPSGAFDDITELVRDIADVPVAIISLVDQNRQWFKSCQGLDACETPRNVSFCAHTILQRSPMVIEDAAADERFSDNPLVVNPPFIRFYAGFPLITRNGLAMGSLCAVDHQPRRLSEHQRGCLQRLARLTINQMELWRERRLLAASEQALEDRVSRGDDQPDVPVIATKAQILSMAELMISQRGQSSFALLRVQARELNRLSAAMGEAVITGMRTELEQRLLSQLPDHASCGRLNDQEWLVLLPFTSDEERLTQLATRLTQVLPQPIQVADQFLGSPVAVGIAMYRGNYDSADSLMADAAIALQQASGLSGSAFRFIDLTSRLQVQDDLRLELELRDGLDLGQLQSYFQPLVNLHDGRVVGVEALARWRGLDGQLVPPNRFVPVAQRADLLGELDLRMISQSIAASWILADAQPGQPMLLSLNLSSSLLESPALLRRLFAILDSQPLPEHWQLQLEVLEGAMQLPADALRERLDQLSDRGVLLAIDDFGTGFSSLDRLNTFPFHTLKVDMSFVHRLEDPQQPSSRILEVIQAMADTFELHTTTEGVETPTQRDWLRRQGFHWGQGYLFARPMPLQEAADFIRNVGNAGQETDAGDS